MKNTPSISSCFDPIARRNEKLNLELLSRLDKELATVSRSMNFTRSIKRLFQRKKQK